MTEYALIGKRLPRVDSPVKATGEAKYTVDIKLPGMLAGKILRSLLPHARILHIDTSRAERLLGVKGVITGKDTLGVKHGGFSSAIREDWDECSLAMDKVRFIGDAVAAVAASEREHSRRSPSANQGGL